MKRLILLPVLAALAAVAILVPTASRRDLPRRSG